MVHYIGREEVSITVRGEGGLLCKNSMYNNQSYTLLFKGIFHLLGKLFFILYLVSDVKLRGGVATTVSLHHMEEAKGVKRQPPSKAIHP